MEHVSIDDCVQDYHSRQFGGKLDTVESRCYSFNAMLCKPNDNLKYVTQHDLLVN